MLKQIKPSSNMIPKGILVKIFKIRFFESMLLDYFHKGIIHGTTHTFVGQEDKAVLISEYIDKTHDKVF